LLAMVSIVLGQGEWAWGNRSDQWSAESADSLMIMLERKSREFVGVPGIFCGFLNVGESPGRILNSLVWRL
jgi:hypothetical protein